jgi:formyltetrahydrofolate-dependent phosphoribosylglycinamide formyltransferase
MISGHGSNLQAMIDACAAGQIAAQVVLVVSNRRAAYGLERAKAAGIPTLYFPLKPYSDDGRGRQAYDTDLAGRVAAYQPDVIALAGWMHIFSNAFLQRFPGRVLNIHPALPGLFPGTHSIERAYQAFQAGEITHTGVMVHRVPDEGVDVGPVVVSETVPIYPTDTLEMLEERVHQVEHRLYVQAIGKVIDALLYSPAPGVAERHLG